MCRFVFIEIKALKPICRDLSNLSRLSALWSFSWFQNRVHGASHPALNCNVFRKIVAVSQMCFSRFYRQWLLLAAQVPQIGKLAKSLAIRLLTQWPTSNSMATDQRLITSLHFIHTHSRLQSPIFQSFCEIVFHWNTELLSISIIINYYHTHDYIITE